MPLALPGAAPVPVLAVVAEHLGSLHAHERLLVLVVAFGPFVVLGLVVRSARRRALAEDAEAAAADAEPAVEREPAEGS